MVKWRGPDWVRLFTSEIGNQLFFNVSGVASTRPRIVAGNQLTNGELSTGQRLGGEGKGGLTKRDEADKNE